MGERPDDLLIHKIRKKALAIRGVKGINDLRAHYVGNYVHVEVHIEVNEDLSTRVSHEIGKRVQRAVESIQNINKAFVHVDPR